MHNQAAASAQAFIKQHANDAKPLFMNGAPPILSLTGKALANVKQPNKAVNHISVAWAEVDLDNVWDDFRASGSAEW